MGKILEEYGGLIVTLIVCTVLALIISKSSAAINEKMDTTVLQNNVNTDIDMYHENYRDVQDLDNFKNNTKPYLITPTSRDIDTDEYESLEEIKHLFINKELSEITSPIIVVPYDYSFSDSRTQAYMNNHGKGVYVAPKETINFKEAGDYYIEVYAKKSANEGGLWTKGYCTLHIESNKAIQNP